MLDVERWLRACIKEADDAGATVEKDLMWTRFAAYINTDPEVGRDRFFSLLGNAMSRVGYTKVKPVSKKLRRVAYTGIMFKDFKISTSIVKQWMMSNYCEGAESDEVLSEDLWQHFRLEFQIQDIDSKSVFFSLLGKNVFKQEPFLKVSRQLKRKSQGIKMSTFKYLKVKNPIDRSKNDGARQDSAKLFEVKSQEARLNKKGLGGEGAEENTDKEETNTESKMAMREKAMDPADIKDGIENKKGKEIQSEACGNEEVAVDYCEVEEMEGDGVLNGVEDDEKEDVEKEGKAKDWTEGDIKKSENVCDVEGAEQNEENQDNEMAEMEFEEDKDDLKEDERNSEEGDKDESFVEEVNTDSDPIEIDVDDTGTDMSEDTQSKPRVDEEELCATDDIYHKYYKKINNFLLCHLPGRPKSFKSYLKSVFPDPSVFNVERHIIHSSSADTTIYKDARIRAFVAACFPPIKVGSFAGKWKGFSFEGDVFPQFSQVGNANFSCEICIPYSKWAITNHHAYSAVRSKQAPVDAILSGTAKLEFSGIVQLRDHSFSKCHVEAKNFWSKERAEAATSLPPTKTDKGKKERDISAYFKKEDDHLN